MAINVQKLLPAAKTSAIAKIGAKTVSSSLAINKKTIDTKKLTALSIRRSEENVSIIKKSLIDIDGLLKSVLTEDQKTERTKRIRKEQEENEQRETKLETPKESKKFNLPKVSLPGMSFLDRIKRFLFFTALGWLFTKFQDQLPKLTGIIKIITPIAGVVENVFKFILESVVNFIDRGYQTYDKIRGLVKTVGGEKAQGEFDKISGKLNEYINYVLIGGMALTGAINTFANNARKYKPPKPTPQGTPRGPVPQRGPAQRVVRPVQADSIKASRAVIGKQATRQLLRLAKGPLSRLPIVGALVEFGLSWALGDNPGKAAFRGVGTLLLGAVGSLIMPGFGTFIGGYAGAELAGKLYDVLFANKVPGTPVQTQRLGGKVIRRYAKGGEVLGFGGRTLTTKKSKKPYIPPKVTQPGKDVGGKKNIRKLFPDPSYKMSVAEWNLAGGAGTYADYEEQWKKQKDKPNPYRALTNVAAILKDIPYGIGTLMGAAVDVALGQKIDENTFKGISFGLENLFDTFRSISNKTSQGLFAIQNQVPTMATGGQVSRTFNPSSRVDGDPIKIIGKSIKQRVNESIREVQKQISLKAKKTTSGGRGGGGGGDYGVPPRLGPGGPITTVPGILDQLGRPVRFAKPAADAFILMMEAAKKEKKPFRGSDIASTYRDVELNRDVGGAENSPHLHGLAADIHGTTGAWIRSKGKDYGWVPYDYEGTHGGHYEYVGGGKNEKPLRTVPDVFKPGQKKPPGQIPDIFQQKPKSQVPPIFQLPGQQPQPQPTGNVYRGTASWYGRKDGFHGNPTSSGEIFNTDKLTAAIQIGLRDQFGGVSGKSQLYFAKVTNLDNGKTVTVKINDVGPLSSGGIIDLSEAAFKQIASGGLGQGRLYNVTVQKMGPAPRESAKVSSTSNQKTTQVAQKIVDDFSKIATSLTTPSSYQNNNSDTNLISMQGGGYIPKQKPKNKAVSLTSYPSYADGGTQVMIQPIIIRETVPISVSRSSGGATTFMIAGGVNSSNMQSLVRG